MGQCKKCELVALKGVLKRKNIAGRGKKSEFTSFEGRPETKKYCGAVDTRAAVLVQNVASLALILPLAFLFETRVVIWEGEFWFALLWSSIGLSVVAIALYFVLVQRGAAVKVTSMIYLSPPTTAIMGWAVFGETMSALALLGFLATVVGVALSARG